jgi:hypothetical protein
MSRTNDALRRLQVKTAANDPGTTLMVIGAS